MNMARFYDDLPKLKHGDVPTFPVRVTLHNQDG